MSRQPTITDLAAFSSELREAVADRISQHLLESPTAEDLGSVQNTLLEMERSLRNASYFLLSQYNRCTPIGRLSDDLLLEILKYCMHDTSLYYDLDAPIIPPAFYVCTKWSNVAKNSSSLWTRISLPMNTQLFKLFVTRSGSSSLDVFLSNQLIHRPRDLFEVSTIRRIGGCLRQLLPRISHLQIFWEGPANEEPEDEEPVNEEPLSQLVTDYIGETELSTLRSLHITEEGGSATHIKLNTPMLRSLRFGEGSTNNLHLSSEHLVILELDRINATPKEILNLLYQFPTLKHCRIKTLTGANRHESDVLPFVSVPKLQTLLIAKLNLCDMIDVLNHLDIPSSTSLTLAIYPCSVDTAPFHNFFGPYIASSDEMRIVQKDGVDMDYILTSKSGLRIEINHRSAFSQLASYGSNLSLLDLHVRSLPSLPVFGEILRKWTSITHLGIHTYNLELEWALFTLFEGPEILLPNLQILDCTHSLFSTQQMIKVLRFRQAAGVGLRELKITKTFRPLEDIDQLQSLVEELSEYD
ncbi:hypothetical protein SISNIDRAFT_457855 [Sistotremastrum niveocremeum HHB9708]|uniref:F-box domain-containing protein n=1 Tax=Sistotremastrum niveocremeum HHB9708 TaxID=1314777 RepID=A0A164R827_9AGAM|nr:hypothetical protein SISNIDRAFT_457855 [Sistotremastrum niveocremeum HHB9708]